MFLEGFLAHKYGKAVREENISAWRRTVCGDLTSAFRPYDPKASALAFLNRDKFVVGIEKTRYKELPSNFKRLTAEQIEQINRAPLHRDGTARQESGIRPACALPYELYADGRLSDDGKHYELRLSAANQVYGVKAAGAPFNVYLRNTKDAALGAGMMASTYAVTPGDTLMKQFPLTLFTDTRDSIEVHGPNGFYRSFTGPLPSFPLEVRTDYDRHGKQLTGTVQVHLQNKSSAPVTITITDNAYHSQTLTRTIQGGSGAPVVLKLQGSRGWYDFSVKADGWKAESRYAGRVETGEAGVSDPLMGGEI
jgi:phospholipase C